MATALLTPNRNGTAAPPKLLGPDGKEMASDTGIPLAHYANFAAIWNAFNQTYSYTYDEAIKASWQNALSMRRDVFIMALLDERYSAVTQSPWYIDHPDEEDEGEIAVAEELGELVKAIPMLTDCFTNLEEATWYGRAGVQFSTGPCDANGVTQTGINYHVPLNGDKIQVGWDGIPRVMISSTVQNDYQKKGWNVITGMQSPMVVLDRPELRERFAINQYRRMDADYFEGEMAGMVGGVGLRSWIYWAWWMRQEMLGWAVNYMRKVGTLGLLVFPFAEGNHESEQAAQENIKQAGNRSSLMVPVPAGSDPKQVAPFVISPSNAGIDSLTSMIDSYWERHIERIVVGQNMSDGSESGNSLGGSGRAEFAANTKYEKIKGDADRLAETLTRDVLKPLHRWNYAGQRFVYKFCFGVKDPASEAKLQSGIALAAIVELKADELREAGGFSKPAPGDELAGSAMQEEPTGTGPEGEPTGKASTSGPSGGIKAETDTPDGGDGGEAENMARYAFVESEHPRADDGKWTDGSGGGKKQDGETNPTKAEKAIADSPFIGGRKNVEVRRFSDAASMAKAIGNAMAEAPSLDDDERAARLETAKTVIGRLPKLAIDHLSKTVRIITACGGLGDVGNQFEEISGDKLESGDVIGGLWSTGSGRLTIDGGFEDEGYTDEEKSMTVAGILAHELGHALDTVNKKFVLSNSPDFASCFESEIKDGQLTDYAATDEQEGFAEFARLLYGSEIPRNEVGEKFPMTLAFFESRGLA